MARGINLSFLADVSSFLRGTKDVEASLDRVSGSLDDLVTDANATGDRVGDAFDDAADGADAAADRMERTFRDTFDRVNDSADDGMTRVRQTVDDDLDGVARGGKAKEVGGEIGAEMTENIGEAFRSGDIGGSLFETLTSLAPALGPLGIGIGIGAAVIVNVIKGMDDGAEKLQAAVTAMFDAVEVDASSLTIKWNRQKLLDGAIDALTEGDATADLAKVQEWIRAGVGEDTIVRALTGEATSADKAAIDALLETHERIVTVRGTTAKTYDEEGKKIEELLGLQDRYAESMRTVNGLATTQRDLYASQADIQRDINESIRNRPSDLAYSAGGYRRDDS